VIFCKILASRLRAIAGTPQPTKRSINQVFTVNNWFKISFPRALFRVAGKPPDRVMSVPFDHLVGAGEQRRRYREIEHPGGLVVDRHRLLRARAASGQAAAAPPSSVMNSRRFN
jgi:hypothetical protein